MQQADARAMQVAVHFETTAKASFDIVVKQLEAGQVNVLSLLNAQQTYLIAVVASVATEANRTLPRSSWRRRRPA